MGDSVQKRQNILGEQRVSDETRRAYSDRLSQFFSEGYINLNEFNARQDVIVGARTMSELKAVFKDLPDIRMAQPAVKPKPKKKAQRSPVTYMVMVIVVAVWTGAIISFAMGNSKVGSNLAASMIIFALFYTAIPKRRK